MIDPGTRRSRSTNSRSAVDHLRAAVDDLVAQRDALARQIEVLERTIAELSGDDQNILPFAVSKSSAPMPRTVRDIIFDIGSKKSAFTLEEIVEAAQAEGSTAKAESISSIISRMKRADEVRGVRRGLYALVKPETPDHSGVSVNNHSSAVGAAGPDEEGGGGHDDGDHLGRRPAPVGPD